MARDTRNIALGGYTLAKSQTPDEVTAIRAELKRHLDAKDPSGRSVGNAKFGIYAFYDYDEEPIYVGQTLERLRVRIRRHLTNQRTDAVAMNVLDPFEVLSVEVWPFWDLERPDVANPTRIQILNQAEYTVFQRLLSQSKLGAVLNEKDIAQTPTIELPPSYRFRIVPDPFYELRKHPDIRIARRASTIANLARVISEREVSLGLRRTLLTQARRLELLAKTRMSDFADVPMPEGHDAEDEDEAEFISDLEEQES